MTRRRCAFPIVLLLAVAPRAHAQPPLQTRDMSGTWVATKEPPAAIAVAPGATFGPQFALRIDGDVLTVTRRIRDANVAVTYPLDGTEVRSRIPGALCRADAQPIETAVREGGGIVMTHVGSVAPGGSAVTKLNVRRVFRLETPDALVVEATMQEGPQSAARSVGTLYRRTPEPMPATPPSPPRATATIAQLEWLSGVWVGSSGSEERWTPAASGSMLAVSRTLRNGVMSEFEFLCITERGGGLVYQAMPNGRSPATDFVLTRIEPTSATFENPAHDFPKMIRYTLQQDGTLEAVVSGDPAQRALTFTFKKVPR